MSPTTHAAPGTCLVGAAEGRLTAPGDRNERFWWATFGAPLHKSMEDEERAARRLQEKDEKAKALLEEEPSKAGPLTVEDLERSRHVAALERRELLRVCGDRCWVHGCENRIFLQRCHRRPFRANGSNRAWNLLYLCYDHHSGFDLGEWWLKRRSDGAWILMGRAGKSLERLREETWRFLDEAERASGSRAPP
jgi:hypothetical protein